MSEQRVPARERLALELEKGQFPGEFVQKVRDGYYDMARSSLMSPMTALLRMLLGFGALALATRVAEGEFDAAFWEVEEWMASQIKDDPVFPPKQLDIEPQ